MALVAVPAAVGLLGIAIERLLLRRLYGLDNLYGLLLTFGLALVVEGLFQHAYGISGNAYPVPPQLVGGFRIGGVYLPTYRAWVVVVALVVSFGSWFVIERTRLGAYLRAGTENPKMLQAFGVNVPLMFTLTYGYGAALAAFAGVMAAPIYQVQPSMGAAVVIVVFAVVVIGGMGSIAGSILTGIGLGLVEGLTKFWYPPGASAVVFVVMALVLLVRPAGLFGRTR